MGVYKQFTEEELKEALEKLSKEYENTRGKRFVIYTTDIRVVEQFDKALKEEWQNQSIKREIK